MSRGVGWQSALWARPLYRDPVAKRVAVSAGGASLRSVKKILSEVESLTSLCPLFPYLHVLRFFFGFFCFFIFIRLFSSVRRLRRAQVLYRAQLLDREQIPAPGEPERHQGNSFPAQVVYSWLEIACAFATLIGCRRNE